MSRDPNYQRLLNSKRWKMLRQEYLRAHPLCERCKAEGLIRSAIDVHHKVPVESAHTLMEMEQLAFDWHNLQALCIPCHASIHKAERSHSKQAHKQREDDRLERWKQRQSKPNNNGIQTEIHAGPIREPSTYRDEEAKAQTDSESNGGSQGDVG